MRVSLLPRCLPVLGSNESSGESIDSQFFNSLAKIDFSELENVTVQEWLDKNIHDKNFAEIVKTLVRLNTYGNDPDIQSIVCTSPNLCRK